MDRRNLIASAIALACAKFWAPKAVAEVDDWPKAYRISPAVSYQGIPIRYAQALEASPLFSYVLDPLDWSAAPKQ